MRLKPLPSRPLLGGVLFFALVFAFAGINPWGGGHEGVWNAPREGGMALFALAALAGVLLERRGRGLSVGGGALLALLASAGFLLAGAASTLLSPQPIWSWTGYPSVGDGLRFWALGVAFAWAVFLALETRVLSPRGLFGALLLALGLHALAVFPQVVDWKLDYTQTQGQTYVRCFDRERTDCYENPNATASGIYRGQMPIGLTSHRGHAAGVLALLGLVAAGLYLRSPRPGLLLLFGLGALALWFTQTRGGWLALWGTLAPLALGLTWKRPGRLRPALALFLVGALSYGLYLALGQMGVQEPRRFPELGASFAEANAYSSGRLELWRKALAALPLRPWLGWGFDGYARASPHAVDWNGEDRRFVPAALSLPVRLVQGEDRLFYLEDPTGLRLLAPAPYAKAHNLFLDLLLSVGVLGGAAYLLWLGAALRQASWAKLPFALAVAGYLLYGLTWYDSVHVTPLALLALGALVTREEVWRGA